MLYTQDKLEQQEHSIKKYNNEFLDEKRQLHLEAEETKLFLEGELERTLEQYRTIEVQFRVVQNGICFAFGVQCLISDSFLMYNVTLLYIAFATLIGQEKRVRLRNHHLETLFHEKESEIVRLLAKNNEYKQIIDNINNNVRITLQ